MKHEAAYKQDSNPRYQRGSYLRAQYNQALWYADLQRRLETGHVRLSTPRLATCQSLAAIPEVQLTFELYRTNETIVRASLLELSRPSG